MGVVLILAVLALFAVILGGVGANNPPSRPADNRTTAPPSEAELKTICRRAVINSLKAPSTADFVSMVARELDSGIWEVSGQVDAQNAFGAMIRNHYVCEATLYDRKFRVERVEVQ